MRQLLVATGNLGKVKEIAYIVRDLGFKVSSLADLNNVPSIIEDADTFEGNARIKALTICKHFDHPTLADDSGLEVDALDGKPGIHSARYGGPGLSDEDHFRRLLKELQDIPEKKRLARFRCAVVFARPGKEPRIFDGTLEGKIALLPSGTNGFGYDPVFIPLGQNETLASLPVSYKNKISHRAQALQAFAKYITSQ